MEDQQSNEKTYLAPQSISTYEKDDEIVMIDVETAKWMRTNKVGKEIIDHCIKNSGKKEISKQLSEKYGIDYDIIDEMVGSFMAAAAKVGFLKEEECCNQPGRAESNDSKKYDIEDNPYKLQLWMHITRECNMACPFCIQGGKQAGAVKPFMSLGDWTELFTKLKDVPDLEIIISGGEPTLNKDLLGIIDRCKEITSAKSINVITNGTGVTPDVYCEIARKIDILQISLDGTTADVHDQIRGKGSFLKIKETLKALRENGCGFWLSFTPTKINYKSLPYMINFGIREGAKGLHVNKLMPGGRALGNYDDLNVPKDELNKTIGHLYQEYRSSLGWARKVHLTEKDLKIVPPMRLEVASERAKYVAKPTKRNLCGMGTNLISVDHMGNIFPCPSLHVEDFYYGNLREEEFWEIRRRVVKVFKEMSVNDFEGCSSCDIRYLCGGGCRARAYYTCDQNIKGFDVSCSKENFIERLFDLGPYIERNEKALQRRS